jgi:class 3 adenylate cyclase
MGLLDANETAGPLSSITCGAQRLWRGWTERIEQSLCFNNYQERNRRLTTVLFTDIVDSTNRVAEIGDRQWTELLRKYYTIVRTQLAIYRGREISTAGDGFLATFGAPARAIRCAYAICDGVGNLGLQIRAGLHTGECESLHKSIAGIAVHVGARVVAMAGPNEVLVSSTVRDLVMGSGIKFADHGVHNLKGVPGEWHLFLALDEHLAAPPRRLSFR